MIHLLLDAVLKIAEIPRKQKRNDGAPSIRQNLVATRNTIDDDMGMFGDIMLLDEIGRSVDIDGGSGYCLQLFDVSFAQPCAMPQSARQRALGRHTSSLRAAM